MFSPTLEALPPLEGLARDGFALARGVLSPQAVGEVLAELLPALRAPDAKHGPLRGHGEPQVVASRNVLQLWPGAIALARSPAVANWVTQVLGAGCGLVRGLFFDKPPGQSWGLPWHKDLTIAVREHLPGALQLTKPTRKAGVPHMEATTGLLAEMLTARIHLDEVTDENGPLLVIPGSHRDGKASRSHEQEGLSLPIHAAAGDILFMRPLVTHSSRPASPGATQHRRILHLEFAAARELPDGYEWFEFHRLLVSGQR